MRTRCFAATTLAAAALLAAGCAPRANTDGGDAGRYRLDVPASPPLPALRLDLSVAPHPATDIPPAAVTELANPTYLALRSCAAQHPEPITSGAMVVTFAAEAGAAPVLVALEAQVPFAAAIVECVERTLGPRPVHPALEDNARLSIVVTAQ